jgi:uncharacterized protein
MFDEPLPKEADLRKLATREASFHATLDASLLPRFSGAAFEGAGLIKADLHLGVDEQRVRYIKGTIDCETQLVCQRCMQPMPVHIHSDVNLGIMWDETEAKQLSKSMDPLIVGEDELVDLNEVIEDELLLNMPFVSYHDDENCSQQSYSFSDEATEKLISTENEKDNPFSVLAGLKPNKD